jgi:Nickel responsive protein SCO4226-like
MPEFVAEQYFPRAGAASASRAGEAARRAAEQLAREGARIALVRSIFIPEDETCLFIYEADSVETVRVAGERGGLAFERIVQAAGEVPLP